MVARFDFSQGFQYSDNPDLEVEKQSELLSQTSLDFALDSQTKVQTFSLGFGSTLEYGKIDPEEDGLNNPFVRLAYERNVGRANIGGRFRYREADVSSLVFNEDFIQDGNVLRTDRGTAQTLNYEIYGETGIDAPIGTSFRLAHDQITYSGTTDDTLTDTSTDTAEGQVNFRIDPRILARITGRLIDYQVDGDGVDRRTTGFGVGVAVDINQRVTADVRLSHDRIVLSGDQVGIEEGLSFGIDISQEMTNGTMGIELSSDITENGRRGNLRFRRAKETLYGNLSYSLGVTQREGVGLNPLFGVDYTHLLPRGAVTIGLTQTFDSDSDNNEEINTSLSIGYLQELSEISSFNANLSFFNSNQLGTDSEDSQRLNLSLAYRYSLTRDWGLISRYTHTLATSSTEPDRDSNTIFVGLNRSFNWNP